MAKIIAGSKSAKLAESVSRISKIPVVPKVVRQFPDGETYVRLGPDGLKGLEGEPVFIIHSLYPSQNENLIELFLTIGAVRERGGLPHLVIPYLAYGRQDKSFQPGEAFSLKTVGNILKSLGAEMLITVDAHFHRMVGGFDFFGIKGLNLSAVTLQISHAKKVIGGDFIIAGPDCGSRDFLSGVKGAVFMRKVKYCPVCNMPATECKCKEKAKRYVVRTSAPDGLASRNVLLLDDMVTTGTTIIEAAKALRDNGSKVFVGCTHGLFLGDSLRTLKKYADHVFSTDSVESKVSKVSVANLLADEIVRIV